MNVEFYTGVDERLELPMILPPVPDLVDFADYKVLIADDVADTGATLQLVQEFCEGKVAEVRCAVLYEKPRSVVKCEYVWRRTDSWITSRGAQKTPFCRLFRSAPGSAAGRSDRFDRTPRNTGFKERSTLTKRKLALAAILLVIAAVAVVLRRRHVAGRGEVEQHVQGRVDLRRPAQRRRLVAGSRPGPPRRAEGTRLEGADDLQGERPGRPAGRPGDRQPDP